MNFFKKDNFIAIYLAILLQKFGMCFRIIVLFMRYNNKLLYNILHLYLVEQTKNFYKYPCNF
ncbi:hypothetical protein C1645_746700 [Glomus cerebriforme]|uniref:Uncharacterized protein n=1 Tax=Glomus cerebriforme TaxID=658196 RepID=A0A397TT48_9GLOM|nr:hypothetical protein C1645_746700 [Glomus cerebriforme]